jgi:hypothetical protein
MTKRKVVKLLDATPVVFTIIGISSHENDYRLSWNMNEQLRLAFVQGDSITAGDGNEFTCFVHEDDRQSLLLISNRCDNGFLLGKHKNFDFILKINAGLNEAQMTEWLSNLRNVPLVSAAFPIPVNKQILKMLG